MAPSRPTAARMRFAAGAAMLLAFCLVVYVADAPSREIRMSLQEEGAEAGAEKPTEAEPAAAPPAEAEAEAAPAPPPAEATISKEIHVQYEISDADEEAYAENPEKFTEEHPEKARRIHLKRKAERQDALREEYHKKREEMLERLEETNRARNVVIAILAILVIVTVLLDLFTAFVIENSNDMSKPVVETLLKELTVLGCIALLVFMSVKTGLPQQVSRNIFGTPSELVEIFDMAHILIFLVVVLFVIMIGLILWRFANICDDWVSYELRAIEFEKEGKTIDDVETYTTGSPPEHLPEDLKNFIIMRHNFLNPPVKYSRYVLDPSFKFATYLRECTTELFTELVEVEPETWGVVMVLIIFTRLFVIIPHEDVKLAIFLALGALMLVVMVLTRNKLLEIYMTLLKPNGPASDDNIPFYVQKARDEGRNSAKLEEGTFQHWCNGGRDANPHEKLFWFEAGGPKFMMHIVRTCSFLAAVYFALLVFRFGMDLFRGPHEMLLIILCAVFPLVMMYIYVPQVMKLLILTSSIEMMRRKNIIHDVEHTVRRRRRFFVTRLVHCLKGYARRILKQDSQRSSRELETARMREIKDVFDMYEIDCPSRPGVRYVPGHAVANFFIQLGMEMDKDEVHDVIQELGDGEDGIMYDQTVDFLGGYTTHALTDQMIDAVFVDIDRDNKNPQLKFDNEITEDEFCAKLSQINTYFGTKGSAGGADSLIDWLDWAVISFKINVQIKTEERLTADGPETTSTRVFSPQTFRALLKNGTQL